MVSDLTVIKHNHPKSKYPTHKSGITWQPWVHLPVGSPRRIRKRLPVRNVLVFCNKFFGEGVTLSGIIADQEEIGWNNFVLGRWSTLWQQAQLLHYKSIGSKKSAKRWTIEALHHLMMMR